MSNNFIQSTFDDEFIGDSLSQINYNIYTISTLLYNISSALMVDGAFTSTEDEGITNYAVDQYINQSLFNRLNAVHSTLSTLSSLSKISVTV